MDKLENNKRINLVLPTKLYEKIKEEAKNDNRSLNNFIVNTLEKQIDIKK